MVLNTGLPDLFSIWDTIQTYRRKAPCDAECRNMMTGVGLDISMFPRKKTGQVKKEEHCQEPRTYTGPSGPGSYPYTDGAPMI